MQRMERGALIGLSISRSISWLAGWRYGELGDFSRRDTGMSLLVACLTSQR